MVVTALDRAGRACRRTAVAAVVAATLVWGASQLMAQELTAPETSGNLSSPSSNSLGMLVHQTYPGFTQPSDKGRRELNFNFPGVVRKVNVKEGQAVKAGDVLLVEDERIDQAALDSALADANSAQTKIEYQKAELAQKEAVLKRKSERSDEKVFSTQEVEEARLDVVLSQTRLQLAYDEAKQKDLEVGKQKVKLELLRLTSTIDGVVQKVLVREGEVADPNNGNKPAMIVVENDPLQVEVKLPTRLATRLRVGQVLEVCYPDSERWLPAQITFLDPMADARSGMRLLHLNLGNPSKRESGWNVSVRIPAAMAAQLAPGDGQTAAAGKPSGE